MQALKPEIEYTKNSVQNILEHFFHFFHAMECGNMDALVLIVDMKAAAKKAKLTDQQKKVFFYRFLLDYTQEEIAEVMGITHQAVSCHIEAIINKMLRALNGGDQK
jgi:DNA-directed RNA polymerase specialized sigma24 family protein